MDPEKRLNNLALKIAEKRKAGHVLKWPFEFQKEIIELCNIFGICKTAQVTKVSVSIIHKWKMFFSEIQDVKMHENSEIQVTKIVAQPIEEKKSWQNQLLGTLKLNNVELSIYDFESFNKCMERFFI